MDGGKVCVVVGPAFGQRDDVVDLVSSRLEAGVADVAVPDQDPLRPALLGPAADGPLPAARPGERGDVVGRAWLHVGAADYAAYLGRFHKPTRFWGRFATGKPYAHRTHIRRTDGLGGTFGDPTLDR